MLSTLRIVSRSTWQPCRMSSSAVYSYLEWLIPPTLGTKIMPVGNTFVITSESWNAPLGMIAYSIPKFFTDASIASFTQSAIGAGS